MSTKGLQPDAVLPVEALRVCSWCPTPDASGPATQVHLVVDLGVPGITAFAVRLKSRRAVDELIAALEVNREHVWPTPRGEG